MKRSIWRILEVVAVAGSRAVERVAASGGVSFGEEGEEEGGELPELVQTWAGGLR